jgi:hypothetical protein
VEVAPKTAEKVQILCSALLQQQAVVAEDQVVLEIRAALEVVEAKTLMLVGLVMKVVFLQ